MPEEIEKINEIFRLHEEIEKTASQKSWTRSLCAPPRKPRRKRPENRPPLKMARITERKNLPNVIFVPSDAAENTAPAALAA